MTTATNGVAVIATQLAQTDRRALSEAWYSALHLTQSVAPARPRRAVLPVAASSAHMPERCGKTVPAGSRLAAAPLPQRAQREASPRAVPANERRRPATESGRRIERAVAVLAAHANAPAAHTVDVAGGRVRLLVRSDGRTTRIIAVCSRPLREQVERALASARFALAGAGLASIAP